jgi:hypothetical protein
LWTHGKGLSRLLEFPAIETPAEAEANARMVFQVSRMPGIGFDSK